MPGVSDAVISADGFDDTRSRIPFSPARHKGFCFMRLPLSSRASQPIPPRDQEHSHQLDERDRKWHPKYDRFENATNPAERMQDESWIAAMSRSFIESLRVNRTALASSYFSEWLIFADNATHKKFMPIR
jgi:hypothetical protein